MSRFCPWVKQARVQTCSATCKIEEKQLDQQNIGYQNVRFWVCILPRKLWNGKNIFRKQYACCFKLSTTCLYTWFSITEPVENLRILKTMSFFKITQWTYGFQSEPWFCKFAISQIKWYIKMNLELYLWSVKLLFTIFMICQIIQVHSRFIVIISFKILSCKKINVSRNRDYFQSHFIGRTCTTVEY